MPKRKTSKKPDFSFTDIPPVRLNKGTKVFPHDATERLKDKQFIARALVRCLQDGDAEAFKEILGAHLEVINKTEFARKSKIPERTLYRMVSKQGNPTLDNVARVVHLLSA